ncbi:hypothetical protein ABIA99_002485 [Bradyrhizobium sp. LB12.1]|uniref:hypothetical protein n=1 Tax=Bradyrhizobium sp. LB12.1 TaxID=3156327 RepID=UPI0033985750
MPTSFGSFRITAINSSQFVTANFLSRWDEVVEIAAGQQTTPYQKTGATLGPIIIIEAAAESHPVEDRSLEAVPAA